MIDIALSLTAGKLLSKAAKIYLLVVVKVPRELYSMDVWKPSTKRYWIDTEASVQNRMVLYRSP